jgi:hypothetical protein
MVVVGIASGPGVASGTPRGRPHGGHTERARGDEHDHGATAVPGHGHQPVGTAEGGKTLPQATYPVMPALPTHAGAAEPRYLVPPMPDKRNARRPLSILSDLTPELAGLVASFDLLDYHSEATVSDFPGALGFALYFMAVFST